MQRSGVGGNGGPSYRDRSASVTRPSAAEADPGDDGATALDPPKVAELARAEISAGPASPAASATICTHEFHRTHEIARAPLPVARIAIVMLGAFVGIAGAVFGAWLAMGWW